MPPTPPPPLRRVPREGPLPLSFAQERLWFLHQLDPSSGAYNLLYPLRLRGRLDPELLAAALERAVERHEVLRTIFPSGAAGRPRQEILPTQEAPIRRLELRGGEPEEIERHAREEVEEPFDLAHGPLLRARLLGVAPDDHVLLLVVHHIVADGWSLGLLAQELALAYGALAAGEEPAFEELPVQHADFAAWQREWPTDGAVRSGLDYWREALAGLEPLELPTDRPRTPMRTYAGATVPFRLPRELSARLLELAASERAALSVLLLAALQVLIGRYARQSDVAVGVPVAGRPRRELEHVLGFFANTLVLRADLSGNPPFRTLLARLCERAAEADGRRDLPFERLVAELSPERDLSRNPFFEVSFAFQSLPEPKGAGSDLEILPLQVGTTSARFDLELSMALERGRLAGKLVYKSDLFERGTVEALARRFRTLLEGIAENPDAGIDDLPLLTDEERAFVLEWAHGPEVPATGRRLEELVEAQVDRTPDAVALVGGDEALAYAELDVRADRLAHFLQDLVPRADDTVAVFLERSPRLVLAVLAVLKTGHGYVPVDAEYPAERIAFMLTDSRAPVVLTEERLLPQLPETSARIVLVDEAEAHPIEEAPPPPRPGEDGLAYVMYTSGSTGRPKGAALAHRGLVDLLADWDRRATIRPGAPCSFWTSASFDVSVYEIFSALSSGGTLHVVPEAVRTDPPSLVDWLVEHEIESAYVPPFALPELRARVRAGARPSLRRLMVGVESIPEELLLDLQRSLPEVTIVDAYGPTEASISPVLHTLPPGGSGRPNIPIGRPVANAVAYLLDPSLRLVPPGVPGEICLGGPCLAHGYVGRGGMTAERFVPDPISRRGGERIYRTGDLGRHLPDGTIEFLGRRDTQIKVRGFRVELEEIEATLREHETVRDAVVVFRDDLAAERILVAYVVPERREAFSAEELREALAARLPSPMLPRAYLALDALPLSPNGKIDRRALPDPEEAGVPAAEYLGPRTPTETLLAEAWAEALEVERVGIRDDFFELGGHSLLGAAIVARVQAELGVRLPLRVLFAKATIEELAEEVERLRSQPAEPASGVRPTAGSLVRS